MYTKNANMSDNICLEERIIKDWRKWLAVGNSFELEKKRSLMWIWPTESELQKFGSLLETHKVKHILSIGCGNGLFERIIQECLGTRVSGIEVDRAWWESKYAVKSFIELNYFDDFNKDEISLDKYLQKCCNLKSWNFALMFCYFNNRAAFYNYIEMYKGNILLIIGPKNGVRIFTEPLPLEPHFLDTHHWELKTTLSIGKDDIIALYVRALTS
uniref:Methyltransferase domain-containing protein n=1 Tax=Ceratitis capitata TaxID=7213 RepID=W8CDA7_CERCA